MVGTNDLPTEETINSNESNQNKLRTTAIRNEMENEDRVLESAEIPKVGMIFNTFEEIRDLYLKYAAEKGFDISARSMKRDNEGKIKYCTIVCFTAGRKVCIIKSCLVPRTAVKKTDCKARITMRTFDDGKLYISGFISKHNHELSPENSRYNAFITSLGVSNVNSVNEESINYIARSGSLRLDKDDAESIFNYFVSMQKQDSNFFCVSNMNDECCLRNVFWADGRSQALYESFGDVIVFESRYVNEYKLPLVSFVGVNHHGQSILFGCGLMFHDDNESYKWIFRSWLKCMSGRPPKAIVTDHCPSIQEAVSVVFPKTRHRLCLNDIMKKISSKLCYFDDYIKPETTLKQFMEQYKTILKSKIEKEEYADFTSSSSIIPAITDSQLEKQFRNAYTNEIFKLFQEELRTSSYWNASMVTTKGHVSTFVVTYHVKREHGPRMKTVNKGIFDDVLHTVWCNCCLFEFHGILCRHALAVLFDQDVKEVPSYYILPRWRKDINRAYKGINSCSVVTKTSEQMVHFGKQFCFFLSLETRFWISRS